ncbi:MAG: VanZ family protein, partial [Lachnospiraceae bacterium]|nr:VanZ family protein [Lachnospiraceae bacterium]
QPSVGLFRGSVNFSLFKEYIPFIRSRSWYTFIYLFVGNIVWFVPMGAFFRLFDSGKKKPFSKGLIFAMLTGLCISLSIEILQFVFGKGLAEIDDLILNTLGVTLGYCIFYIIERAVLRRRENKQ